MTNVGCNALQQCSKASHVGITSRALMDVVEKNPVVNSYENEYRTVVATFSGLLLCNKKLGFCVLLKSSRPLMDDLLLPLVLIPVQYGSFLQPQSNSLLAAWPGHA